MKPTFLCLGLALFLAQTAEAGQLTLVLDNGRATLVAQEVPVRQILAEWTRVGGARVVNGEKLAGPPVTLRLENVPEAQALDVVLRTVPGYMIVPRAAGEAGLSTFDRILILPTTSAASAVASPPAGGSPFRTAPEVSRPPMRPPQPQPVDVMTEEGVVEEAEQPGGEEAAEEDSEPGVTPALRPGMPVGGFPGQPNQGGPSAVPSIGAPGATHPGMIAQPQQQQRFRNPYGVTDPEGQATQPGAPPPQVKPPDSN